MSFYGTTVIGNVEVTTVSPQIDAFAAFQTVTHTITDAANNKIADVLSFIPTQLIQVKEESGTYKIIVSALTNIVDGLPTYEPAYTINNAFF
jgi:hypothetical protein